MTLVAPSILSADFSRLGADIKKVTQAGADWLHIDVMDGHFVPNLTIGPCVIKAVRSYSALPFDVHLMMTHPQHYVHDFAIAGADYITIHIEAETDIEKTLSLIKKEGKKAGLSVKPHTNISRLIPFIPFIDLILIMSVEPGFGGQAFIPAALEKIAAVKELTKRKNILISVDGGINQITAPACKLAGADVLVAGSYIFKNTSYQKAIQTLKEVS